MVNDVTIAYAGLIVSIRSGIMPINASFVNNEGNMLAVLLKNTYKLFW
jgi:hypothetical protein